MKTLCLLLMIIAIMGFFALPNAEITHNGTHVPTVASVTTKIFIAITFFLVYSTAGMIYNNDE